MGLTDGKSLYESDGRIRFSRLQFCKSPVQFCKYEPQHKKLYLLTCMLNGDLNEPAHLHSLIRVFVVCMKKLCIVGINVPSEDFDQTAQMCRLIWIIAGHICLKLHFLTLWLLYTLSKVNNHLLSFRHLSERRVLLGVFFLMKIFCSDWPYLIRNHLSFLFQCFVLKYLQ